ncbi:MAG: hypothetical protein IKA65_10670 [Lentisphaeria bacterium]|nr:hypothetical protein [Lentisphaeria bacterium]
MSWKIAVIGGGSVLWMPRLGCDMFLEDSLDGSELVLVDIDPAAAKLIQAYLIECVKVLHKNWRITIADEDSALKGADCVVVSISTGGFEAMDKDYTTPEQFGVFHSVGDTTGPGGIFRTLRNAPVFLDIARKMSKLCPDAWMVHVTNPLSQITRLVNASGLVRCCGLCHEVSAQFTMLSKMLGITDENDLDATVVGVNHFTLFTEMFSRTVKDPLKKLTLKNYLSYREEQNESSGTVDDLVVKNKYQKYPHYLNFYLKDILGVYPAAGAVHIAENFPRFLNSEDLQDVLCLYRKGVLPNRPEAKLEYAQNLQKTLDSGEKPWQTDGRSREMLCDSLVGLLTGESRRIIASLPNEGQITNMPKDAVVETWANVSHSGITPIASGAIPMSCYGFMASVVAEQELTVAAALKKDRYLVRQALFASPEFHEKEKVDALMEAMFDAEKEWINW